MKYRHMILVPILLAAVAVNPSAYGWMRPLYEDATVVDRSELIVIGHLKDGSLEYVPHKKNRDEGASWEHHARLVITEVLKGRSDEKEIPLTIHYGLTPVVGGYVKRESFMLDQRGGRTDYPTIIIEILDTGNSSVGMPPLVKDGREDNIWFLRQRSGIYGREPGTGAFGIVDPEDLQPLGLKDYFLCYLSPDPEASLREMVRKVPSISKRAQRYLDHMAIQRTLRVPDTEERLEKLLPYFLNRTTWDMKNEARSGIIACGAIAAQRLEELFQNPKHASFREDIILMWRDMGFRDAAPILIEILKASDQFWAGQKLQTNWWNSSVGSAETERRRQMYGEMYYSVCALRTLRDQRAKPVLLLTRDRWRSIAFDNPQIVEECDAALKDLASEDKTHDQPSEGTR
jgi:hypothetical protein